MQKIILVSIAGLLIIAGGWYVTKNIVQTGMSESDVFVYQNEELGISLRLPGTATSSDYTIDEEYKYQLRPEMELGGVKFTIPEAFQVGTNLSRDTYLSVESLPRAANCSTNLFLDGTHPVATLKDGKVTYSVASSSNAGAGNRYDEIVYAISGTNPCIAVRYLIHYTHASLYPAGTVSEFNRDKLLAEFDTIRRSLVLN